MFVNFLKFWGPSDRAIARDERCRAGAKRPRLTVDKLTDGCAAMLLRFLQLSSLRSAAAAAAKHGANEIGGDGESADWFGKSLPPPPSRSLVHPLPV